MTILHVRTATFESQAHDAVQLAGQRPFVELGSRMFHGGAGNAFQERCRSAIEDAGIQGLDHTGFGVRSAHAERVCHNEGLIERACFHRGIQHSRLHVILPSFQLDPQRPLTVSARNHVRRSV
jgi:hypothetical protein